MRVATVRDIGALLRERRVALGLTQQQLAEQIGVARQWVALLEAGRSSPRLPPVLDACAVLGLHVQVGVEPAAAGSVERLPTVDLDALLADLRDETP